LKAQFLRSPRIVYVLTGVLAAIVAYGVIAMVLLKDPVPEQGVGAFFGLPPEQNGVPIFNAQRVADSTEARTLLGLPLPRPQSCPASDSSVRSIYVSRSQVQAFVEYQEMDSTSGCAGYQAGHVEVVVHWNVDDALRAPVDEYANLQQEAAQFGGAASGATVAGVPAIVIHGGYEGNCDAPGADVNGCVPAQNNPSSVRLEPGGGLQVWVYGPSSWTTDQIVAVADTVALPQRPK
jgi:hypothetical protein